MMSRSDIETLLRNAWYYLAPHLGKITGVLVGLFAGLGILGPLFGVVIGYFIDEVRISVTLRRRISAFTHSPAGVSLAPRDLWVAGSTALAVAVVAAGVDRIEARYRLLRDEIREEFSLSGRQVYIVETVIKNIVGDGRTVDIEEITSRLGSLEGDSAKVSSLVLCMRLATCHAGPTEEQFRILRLSASRMGLDSNTFSAVWTGFVAPDPSAYELLGVPLEADTAHIRQVYKRLAAQFHPDGGVALTARQLAQSEEAFKKIADAYRTIMQERGERP